MVTFNSKLLVYQSVIGNRAYFCWDRTAKYPCNKCRKPQFWPRTTFHRPPCPPQKSSKDFRLESARNRTLDPADWYDVKNQQKMIVIKLVSHGVAGAGHTVDVQRRPLSHWCSSTCNWIDWIYHLSDYIHIDLWWGWYTHSCQHDTDVRWTRGGLPLDQISQPKKDSWAHRTQGLPSPS